MTSMNKTATNKTRIAGIAIAGSLALAVPFLVSAQSGPSRMEGAQAAPMTHDYAHRAHARHGHERAGFQRGMHGGAWGMLRGLDLTEEQRDRIFAIRHASEPALRDQAKVLRATRGEFAKLAMSNDYDEAKVKELADRQAQAMSTLAQLHTRDLNQVFRVLTPEQQQKAQERMARRGERGPRGEGRAMHGDGRPAAPATGVPGAARS